MSLKYNSPRGLHDNKFQSYLGKKTIEEKHWCIKQAGSALFLFSI